MKQWYLQWYLSAAMSGKTGMRKERERQRRENQLSISGHAVMDLQMRPSGYFLWQPLELFLSSVVVTDLPLKIFFGGENFHLLVNFPFCHENW